MKLNVNAVVLWVALFLGGYLFFGGMRAGLIGLFIGLCISMLAGLVGK
jgi:hypothetical protein